VIVIVIVIVIVVVVVIVAVIVRMSLFAASYMNGQTLRQNPPFILRLGGEEKRIDGQTAQPLLDGFQRNAQIMERPEDHIPTGPSDTVDA
jgi:hypothetical protein